jgi:hypothetical protein
VRRGVLLILTAVLALAPAAHAGEPPDQNDPCSSGGRDSCQTTGAGEYKTYTFGLRWFGDYRHAVPGVSDPTFCIDLRYWYPGRRYGYKQRSAAGLHNRDGAAVTRDDLRRMSYALWTFGRTSDAARQGAVMLFVHRLMGDGAPGEVDPKAVGLASRFNHIARESTRRAGPYDVQVDAPDQLVDGKPAPVTVTVTAASGARMAGVPLIIGTRGGTGRGRARTGADGTATVDITPTSPENGLRVTATASELAAPLPDLYVPTKGKAARNGQRLAAPASQEYVGRLAADVVSQPKVVTTVSAKTLEPGGSVFDTLEVTGLDSQTVTIAASLFGPFGAADDIACDGDAVWTGTVEATGNGTYQTEPTTLPTAGYYSYQESIKASDGVAAFESACAEKAETTVVRGHPQVDTKVSDTTVRAGAELTDTAVVTGLGKLTAPVVVELFGPFESTDEISCDGKPFWKGEVTAKGDGEYKTQSVRLGAAGYYTYREHIVATDAYEATETACGDTAETSFAQARPRIRTLASHDAVIPGATVTDRIRVSGLGRTPATIRVDLYGPFASRGQIRCNGRPARTSKVDIDGDGVVRSKPMRIGKVGFYAFQETIASRQAVRGATTVCAEEAETALGRPEIITGRGDHPRAVRVAAADSPQRVTIDGLGIDAPVDPIGIDLRQGVLGVSKDIARVGWWRDGAAPGDAHGAVLLAGHVDSAARGAGALYALKTAHAGGRVELALPGGRTRAYRVQSVRRVLKAKLPARVFSKRGPARLVIVTCGGPFDAATGHYRDNIILTATPL